MPFSEDLTKKAQQVAGAAAEKAKDLAGTATEMAKAAIDTAKMNMEILSEQREIEKNYRAIGEWFVSEFQGEVPDAVKDVVAAVNASKARIAELEEILLHAVIVDESDVDSDRISIGCRVTVTNLDNGKQLPEYTIVGSQEANVMERKVSEDSPFGKALMGSKAGDQITVEAPRGVIHYRVDTIER